MKIKVLENTFSVCKVRDVEGINFNDEFCFVGKTDEEISVVCDTKHVPKETLVREDGFKGFRIEGVLDFSLIGILSKISTVLAENKIGIFAISTYNTDYILVKDENFERAIHALKEQGYEMNI